MSVADTTFYQRLNSATFYWAESRLSLRMGVAGQFVVLLQSTDDLPHFDYMYATVVQTVFHHTSNLKPTRLSSDGHSIWTSSDMHRQTFCANCRTVPCAYERRELSLAYMPCRLSNTL